MVDQLLGEEDIVVKSMAENYREIEGIGGARILGDGSVSLIFDTATLITMASNSFRQAEPVSALRHDDEALPSLVAQ